MASHRCLHPHRHVLQQTHLVVGCRILPLVRFLCIDMYVDMCIDMYMDMRIDMCIDMCADMCIDMCVDVCIPPTRRAFC